MGRLYDEAIANLLRGLKPIRRCCVPWGLKSSPKHEQDGRGHPKRMAGTKRAATERRLVQHPARVQRGRGGARERFDKTGWAGRLDSLAKRRDDDAHQEPWQVRRLVVCGRVDSGLLCAGVCPSKLIVHGNAAAT